MAGFWHQPLCSRQHLGWILIACYANEARYANEPLLLSPLTDVQ